MTATLRQAPIRTKLTWATMAAVASALVSLGVVYFIWQQRSLRSYAAREMGSTALVIADTLKGAVAFGDATAASETLEALQWRAPIEMACVYDVSGDVLARYAKPQDFDRCPARVSDGDAISTRQVTVVRPVVASERRVGTLYVRRNYDDIERQLTLQALVLFALASAAMALALVLSRSLMGVVASPIAHLAETARAVARQRDYSLRARKESDDELGVLVDAFNDMLLQLEELLRREQEASRLKDEFLATLSHELRTPLNAVMGWAHMAGRGQLNADKQRAALASIERNALALSRLVDDLLDVSRILAGKLRLQRARVDWRSVVDAAVSVVRPAADAKGIRIITDVPPPGPERFHGDPDRLQQMLWNLLSNGVKFTPPGGEVRIELRANGDVTLRVADTGQGIDAGFLPRVFDLFRQADASSTREHAGLGLGLTIAKQIVELHGGSIQLESPGLGLGTTVTVHLPKQPALTPAHDVASPLSA